MQPQDFLTARERTATDAAILQLEAMLVLFRDMKPSIQFEESSILYSFWDGVSIRLIYGKYPISFDCDPSPDCLALLNSLQALKEPPIEVSDDDLDGIF